MPMFSNQFVTAECLAVDDDPLVLKLAEAACRKLNVRFNRAGDVHTMIEAFKESRFDLLLLDNDIAGVRGHEVLEYIEPFMTPNLRIIVYSSEVLPQDQAAYKRFKVQDILTKPVTIDKLSFAMRRALKL